MPNPLESKSEPTYKDAIAFFLNDIKRMAEKLNIDMMPTFWHEIITAHQAMADLLYRNYPPR